MITGIGSVAVLVTDAKRSAKWYRDKLGFEVLENRGHPVVVMARGSRTYFHLCEKCDAWEKDRPGGRTGVWLRCGEPIEVIDPETGLRLVASKPDRVEKTYTELKRKGVRFREELTTTSWGKYAILEDPDGNLYELS